MKQILLLLLLSSMLFSNQESYEDYEPQMFFDRNDVGAFFANDAGELLKKILVNGHEYYMEQDGDLYDEDVATIDEPIFGAREEQFSFGKSKRLLATQIYPHHQKAFYSDCDYVVKEKKLIPLHKTCGFHYRKNKKRSERIEWEHIVPAWHFGHQLHCWQNGGRMTCRQTNTKFRQMEADMHNLVPAIGEINGDRSNFKYGMIQGEPRVYGKVDMEIAFKDKRAEPRDMVFGDIARTYFYMRDRYGLEISKAQEKMFIAWNNLDPVDAWEREKNQLVKKLQGDENLYITHYRKLEQLGDPMTPQTQSTSTTQPNNEIDEIKNELSQKYGAIFDRLPPSVSGIILTLIALWIWYRRRAPSRSTTPKKEKKPSPKKKENIAQDKDFMILSKLEGKALSVNENEEIIIQEPDKNNPHQIWRLNKANQQKPYYFIQNTHSGRVIEIKHGDTNDGATVILNKKKSRKNDHQEWLFKDSKTAGYYFIVNRETLNVLDIKNRKTLDGTPVHSYHQKVRSTENQEWRLQEL